MEKYYMLHTLHFMYCVWISEQTAGLDIYNIDRFIFYNWGWECWQCGKHSVLI